MNPIIAGAAIVTAVGTIGSGALYLDHAHVAASEFKQYIEQQQAADERDYVLDLKEQIREVRYALITRPDDTYLKEALEELLWELCDVRPEDRMCED